jgi:NAD(P)-dependent dehydrogenase (short-subunit alcohol dehydrogenase family)
VRATAALFVGGALGAATAAGSALLLYTGRGFLATAGFLLAVSIAAVAAGLWVGAPEGDRARAAPSRRRWLWLVIAFNAAGAFAAVWDGRDALRAHALGGALAVLLILAEPAYAAGSVIAVMDARERWARAFGGMAVPTLIGAAAGVILATTLLIPNFDPPGIFFGAAALLALTGGIESARQPVRSPSAEDPMRNRAVIVTGVGGRGQVGFAIAEHLLAGGARLVVTGHSAGVNDLAAELSAHGTVVAVEADLTEPADAERVVAAARERFGHLDALINVAGGLGLIRAVAETGNEEWRREIQRNADTAFNMSRAALPLLRESRGAIVNFASPAGARAGKLLAAYSAGKAAVIALTRSLALEERAHGVRVNAIAPGTIDTEQNRHAAEDPDSARYVTREQVAEVALFLISPAASGVSGETIFVLGDTLG